MMRYPIIFFIVFNFINLALATGFQAQKEKRPLKEFSIIVGKEGYYPKQLSIFEGEKLRLYVTSMEEEASCFSLPAKKIFLSAVKGKITIGEAVFERAGRYRFYCPAGKIGGTLVVLPRSEEEERNISPIEKDKKSIEDWVPRDF